MKGVLWSGRDGLHGAVLYEDALAALEAREQQVIDRAVELLRGDGPREYLGPPAPLWTEDMRRYYLTGMYEAADFLERELRPEGTDA